MFQTVVGDVCILKRTEHNITKGFDNCIFFILKKNVKKKSIFLQLWYFMINEKINCKNLAVFFKPVVLKVCTCVQSDYLYVLLACLARY